MTTANQQRTREIRDISITTTGARYPQHVGVLGGEVYTSGFWLLASGGLESSSRTRFYVLLFAVYIFFGVVVLRYF